MSVAAVIPIAIVSLFWLAVGAVVPCFIRGPNKVVIQTSLILTAVCSWLFWICAYLFQLHPLIGPTIKPEILANIIKQWTDMKH